MRKAIIKSKEYNSYLRTGGLYGNLEDAEVFYEKNISSFLNHSDYEVIYLDSEEGIELIGKEISRLEELIPKKEAGLEKEKENLKKLSAFLQ